MDKWLCWYAYSGQETEGRLEFEPPIEFMAADLHEAMWKFHFHMSRRNGGMNPITNHYKDLDAYREQCKEPTGWGYCCRRLA